uniref:Uncharacterized protein n=1 Tax=Arundo donax TaxID=35708 RepID=A0A0A9GRV9_ARUDO
MSNVRIAHHIAVPRWPHDQCLRRELLALVSVPVVIYCIRKRRARGSHRGASQWLERGGGRSVMVRCGRRCWSAVLTRFRCWRTNEKGRGRPLVVLRCRRWSRGARSRTGRGARPRRILTGVGGGDSGCRKPARAVDGTRNRRPRLGARNL